MKEVKLIYGTDCARCHQMMNFLPKRCEENSFLYSEENIDDSIYKNEIESLPTVIVKLNDSDGTGMTEIKKYNMEEFISTFIS